MNSCAPGQTTTPPILVAALISLQENWPGYTETTLRPSASTIGPFVLPPMRASATSRQSPQKLRPHFTSPAIFLLSNQLMCAALALLMRAGAPKERYATWNGSIRGSAVAPRLYLLIQRKRDR